MSIHECDVTATHEWTIVNNTSHRRYVEDKLSKKNILTSHCETPKDISTKSEETQVWYIVLPSCKFSR